MATPKEPVAATTADQGERVPVPRRPKTLYAYIQKAWKDPHSGFMDDLQWNRLVAWRHGPSFDRVEHPTRLDRARALGYKAKAGYVIVRARVRRGGLRKHKIKKGRRPKRKGILKITMKKSIQRIAEERVQKRYPNLEVLNSYWVGEDGKQKFYEVIMVDPDHPVIRADPDINWIAHPAQRGRVYRGLTSAGKKGRGLRHTGKGAEHLRPSRQAYLRRKWRKIYPPRPSKR